VNERFKVRGKDELLSYFTKDAWTHHFVLTKENNGNPRIRVRAPINA
jgi:hypothetical protein